MSVITPTIPDQPEAAIASYDYTDIAEGTGVSLFYAFYAVDTALIPRMSTTAHYSQTGKEYTYGGKSGGMAVVYDETFESKAFNLPRSIKGTAIFRIPYTYAAAVSDQDLAGQVTITVYTYDGSTQTQVATITALKNKPGTGKDVHDNTIELIIPKTLIKKGWTLRVRVQLSLANEGGDERSAPWIIGHDPKDAEHSYVGNSTATITHSQMLFYIPFDLNL